MVLYNAEVCPTEFALGDAEFSEPNEHEVIYKEWHKEVVKKLEAGELKKSQACSGIYYKFNDRTWHQGTETVKNGWRYFMRISWNTQRKFSNEIRRQVQVYQPFPFNGW